jgi:hypothetical protein
MNALVYITEPVVTAKGATNRMKLNQLDDSQGPMMRVVKEFPDVFFNGLSVMPPDRDIKFVIVYLTLLLYVRNLIGWLLSN